MKQENLLEIIKYNTKDKTREYDDRFRTKSTTVRE